ncbi:hypothetical protein EDB83DRAFT_2319527 [Lactarius deliciosus]|nr:hypothetical protein EDB83DRAFT_2319527 [Lactarius deliciosus]
MSPPSQPSLAASRHGFRVSAANLYMGLATSGKWPVPFGIGIKSESSRTCSLLREQLTYIGSLLYAIDAIIGCLVDVRRRYYARFVMPLACGRRLRYVHELQQSIGPSHDLRSPWLAYVQLRLRARILPRILRTVLISVGPTNVESGESALISCVVYDWAWCSSIDFHSSPSHCVFGAITTIGSGEEMELENGNNREVSLRSGINVLFPSVRAGRMRGFSIRSKVTRDDIMGSAVGEQQERGMSISGQTVPSAQLCLCARDVIQLGHSRVYEETVDELKECFGSGVRGCFRFEDVLQSQRLATFEYGFGIEIRVLRWGLRKRQCDYRSVSYSMNASPRAMVFAEVSSAAYIHFCKVLLVREDERDIAGCTISPQRSQGHCACLCKYVPCDTMLYASGIAATSTYFMLPSGYPRRSGGCVRYMSRVT